MTILEMVFAFVAGVGIGVVITVLNESYVDARAMDAYLEHLRANSTSGDAEE